MVAATPSDLTAEALKDLASAADTKPRGPGTIVETARALGFVFDGDSFMTSNLPKLKDGEFTHYFAVTTYRGNREIIIDEGKRTSTSNELRSCWITPAGHVNSAALTTKVNGTMHSEKLTDAEAQVVCRKIVDFWVQHYRDDLRKP
jgi:hypothetical protein